MNFTLKTAAIAFMAAGLVAPSAYAEDATPPVKKHVATRKAKTPPPPTVAEQIQALRQDLENQINSLKTDLADKDAQLRKAQQAAADAQAAADKAQAAASTGQQAVTENAAAVSTLQSTVTDMKAANVSIVQTISDETSSLKKAINSPSVLHYKGITLAPGGYLAAESVYRSKATGGDIPTAFSGLPYEGADGYKLSEFFGSARQSRLSLMAEGKVNWGTMRGYYETDFLGTGITSNNNQSNSYVMRQRVLWGQAETNRHFALTFGQLWSLATEDKKGISNLSGDIMTPQTIDPNYVVGFVWTRQYGVRLTKTFSHAAFGIAAENPQLLYTASLAGNTPYAVLGSAGANGGNYNAAISGLSGTTTYIQNYANQTQTDAVGNKVYVSVPQYNTIFANSNVANLSFNQAPDIIAKIALDPGWGHYELIGIGGFAHETVYPGVTTDTVKYGNQVDIAGFNGAAPGTKLTASDTTTAYSNSIMVGGVAGSFRVPMGSKLIFGGKALYGPGIGRYGNSTLADVTSDAAGELAPIHNFSGLVTVEANPTPRLALYLNYGLDYAGRTDFGTGSAFASTLGSPTATFCETGATAANASTFCSKSPTAAMIAAGGTWGGHWSTPTAGTTAVGYGSRLLNNSACNTLAAPGLNAGGSTGFLPGGSCGAQTRDVQEITGGYWYDIYKGDRGRLRQSIQYGYAVREGWSGAGPAAGGPGIGAKGIDNMFWTAFRYYLP